MNTKFTEQDLDALIASVEATLSKAESLAKSSLKKDDEEAEAAAAPAPEAGEAPAEQMPEAEAAPKAAPAMEEAPAEQAAPPAELGPEPEAAPAEEAAPADQGEEALEGESEEAPLTDEELGQIYGSMSPDELERHYAIIRQHLKSAYQKAEEKEADEEEDKKEEKEDMEKSEGSSKIAVLEKKLEEQAKVMETMAKAFEMLAKPQRKAVTDIEYVRKSESETESAKKNLTPDEIRKWYAKSGPASLTKGERETINAYFLHGEGKEEVEKIINNKGGK